MPKILNNRFNKNAARTQELKVQLGKRVLNLRRELGLRLVDVSERACLSIGNISSVERGQHVPTLRSLEKIADALGKPISFFLGEEAHGSVTRYGERTICSHETTLKWWTERLDNPLMPFDTSGLSGYKIIINGHGCVFSSPELWQEGIGIVRQGKITLNNHNNKKFDLVAGDTFHLVENKFPPIECTSHELAVILWFGIMAMEG